jgi:hypothetical protein
MTNEEQIVLLNNQISNLDVHIGVLENNILDDPDSDHPDKPLRQDVLNNLYAIKQDVIQEIEQLTEI